MSKVLTKVYDHHGVSVNILFTETVFFNATIAAKAFDKEAYEWLRSKDCKEYVAALIEKSNRENSGLEKLEEKQLIRTIQGGAYKGTWLHNKLAVPFARWLNVHFAIWCDEIIHELILTMNGQAPKVNFHQHLQRTAQLDNSKRVNALMYERGGQPKVINYNRVNCMIRTGKAPNELIKEYKKAGLPSMYCGSAKEVLRKMAPEKACGMSFADDLIVRGGDELKSLDLSVKAEEIFSGMLALGVAPGELFLH
jgi:hypothetical protein